MRTSVPTLFVLFLLATLAAAAQGPARNTPPQTGKLVAIEATGSRRYTEAQIAEASGLHIGDSVDREAIQAGANRLAQLGLLSKVNYRYSSAGEDIRLQFQVEDAPTLPVSFDNFPWFTDEELTEALKQSVNLFDGTAPEQGSILDVMTDRLQKLLAARSIHASVERTPLALPAGGGMMQQFKVVGASLNIAAVQFSVALATESRRVQDRLSDLVGKPYSRFAVEVFTNEQVRPVYLECGHLRVRFGRPQARFTGDPNRPLPESVLVIVPIEAGPIFRWGGVEWRGNVAFPQPELDALVPLNTGEIADGVKIAGAWLRVQDEYARRGYLDAEIKPEAVFDDAAQHVSYRVSVTEGVQYRVGELVITGLSPAAERKLLEAWHLSPGQIFDRIYFDEFIASGIKKVFAASVVHFDEVGHWLRRNPAKRTVDVLLDFK